MTGPWRRRLEPGLELIDVRGDAVRGYRTSRSGDATRVVVTLAEGVRGTTLQYLAHASVPPEGTWSIPAIRPIDANWTGGRTTVILNEGHAVRECRERAGRAVPSGPSEAEAGAAGRLVFEASAPRSVAELVLARPGADLACTVRGQVVLGGTPPRLDCRLDWSLHRGSVSQLEVEALAGLAPRPGPDRGARRPAGLAFLPVGVGGDAASRDAAGLRAGVGPMDLDRGGDLGRVDDQGTAGAAAGCTRWGRRSWTRRGWRGGTAARRSVPIAPAAWPGSIPTRSPAWPRPRRRRGSARSSPGDGPGIRPRPGSTAIGSTGAPGSPSAPRRGWSPTAAPWRSKER